MEEKVKVSSTRLVLCIYLRYPEPTSADIGIGSFLYESRATSSAPTPAERWNVDDEDDDASRGPAQMAAVSPCEYLLLLF